MMVLLMMMKMKKCWDERGSILKMTCRGVSYLTSGWIIIEL